MIFVTVGTFKFDELVETVDRAVGSGVLKQEFVIQIGGGAYEPLHCKYFRSATSLQPYYDRAELVVGHGGTGTTFEVLGRGLNLISVANHRVKDNHQHEFLEAMEKSGYLRYCREMSKLPEMILFSRSNPMRGTLEALPWLPIAEEVDHAEPVCASFLRQLQPWFLRCLNRIRMKQGSVELIASSGRAKNVH